MLFGFFQTSPLDHDDDIATGTYADGMIGTPLGDPLGRPRERNQSSRRSALDRDYAAIRTAGQTVAGLVP